MLNLKVLFLLGLALPCFWTLSVLDQSNQSNSQEEDHGSIEHSDEKFKARINWGPVWDDIDGSNEFVLRYQSEENNCSVPNGKGLQNLLMESKKLLPSKGIKEIVDSYAKDPEVIALKKFIESSEYRQKVDAIRNSEEHKILKAYACHVLHIDIADSHYITRNIERSSQASGIRGLINKIQSIMPHQKLMDLYNELMASDEELVKAVAHLKSNEFKQILQNLHNNVPACKELRDKLSAIGVPVDEIRGMISSILGWNLDFDALV